PPRRGRTAATPPRSPSGARGARGRTNRGRGRWSRVSFAVGRSPRRGGRPVRRVGVDGDRARGDQERHHSRSVAPVPFQRPARGGGDLGRRLGHHPVGGQGGEQLVPAVEAVGRVAQGQVVALPGGQ